MKTLAPCWPCCLLLFAFVCGCGDDTKRLIADLRDGDLQTQRYALRELMVAPQATEELVSALSDASHSNDVVIRTMAVTILGRLGSQSSLATQALVPALDDSDRTVQFAAASALLEINSALEAPRKVVLSEIRQVNPLALVLVAELGAEASWAAPALRQLITHRDEAVRELAQRSLQRVVAK